MEAIGVGCYWFACADEANEDDEDFDPTRFLAQIKEALEEVDNVSNVKIYKPAHSTQISGSSYEEGPQGYNFFPLYNNVTITFDIFMPARLIEKYSFFETRVETEHFHVEIVYDGQMPVTYISYNVRAGLDAAEQYFPSTAVMVIRKYLEEKFDAHSTVEFQSLGPSPFHADFFAVDADESGGWSAEDKTPPARGYRIFCFKLPKLNEFEHH